MNKRKIAIIFFIIILTVSIIIFLTTIIKNSGKRSKNKENKIINFAEEKDEENIVKQQNNDFTKYKLTKLDNQNVLSTINFCINLYKRYSSNVEKNDSIDNRKTLFSVIPNEIINSVGNDINDYIIKSKDEYRIDKIYSSIQDIDDKPSENKYTYYLNKNIILYLLKITRHDSAKNTLENNTIGIMIDLYNGYFWIIPYKYFERNNIEIENESSINLLEENSNLSKSNLNQLSNDTNNNEQNICKIYYDNFVFDVKYDIEKAYQDLDDKYKTNGYDENAYLNFLKQKNLDNGIMIKSSINITNDYKYLFQIIDEENNIINFTSNDILKYKVIYPNLSLN